MGKIRLKVLTVPTLDPVTHQEHTTFSVSTQLRGDINYASGWTLKDAIDNYCRTYNVERDNVILERPFFPQRMLKEDEYRQ